MNPSSPSDAREVRPPDAGERKSELRAVLAMSIPVVITTSSKGIMDVVDFAMVSALDDPAPQAAILPAQLVVWSYLILGMGTVSVVSTFASQALGRERPRECSAFAWQSVYTALAWGLVGIAVIPLLPAILRVIGHAPEVQEMEFAYAWVVLLGGGPTIAAAALGWFFIGIHRPWVAMWSVIEANLVNVAVSYVLIFGKLGFEPMGISGAAWGTSVAVTYRAIRLGITLVMPRTAEAYASRRTWKPSLTLMRRFIRVGLPAGVRWFSEVVVWAVFVNLLIGQRFGTTHLIATNTMWQYLRVSFLPTLGVGQALTAMVGRSIGRRDPQGAIRETRTAVMITMGYVGLLSIVFVIWRAELIAVFNGDPEVVAIGGKLMICAAVFQIFDAMGITYDSALRGAGDTFVPALFFSIWMWLSVLGGGWLIVTFYPEWGSVGAWIAGSGCIVVTGLFLSWRWSRRAWMRIDLFRNEPENGEGGAAA